MSASEAGALSGTIMSYLFWGVIIMVVIVAIYRKFKYPKDKTEIKK